MEDDKIIRSVQQWVQSLVVDLNLCPFAKRELVKDRVRFVVTKATTEAQLSIALQTELELLNGDSSIETTLLIHPRVLLFFHDYNRFLKSADRLLKKMKLEGVYQIAGFHPDYQFGDADLDDAGNYTNRSPYPLLHLLREDSLERAIADYPDVDRIPLRNIALMKNMGTDKLRALLRVCLNDVEKTDK